MSPWCVRKGQLRPTRDVLTTPFFGDPKKAIKELQALCARMRQRWDVRKVAIAHRTGVVPVGEASVVVAVSSAHRREALEATQFGIDELKETVPIWKKEVYEDGSAWKANKEALA